MNKDYREAFFKKGVDKHVSEFQEEPRLSLEKQVDQVQQARYFIPWRFALLGLMIGTFFTSGSIRYMSDYQSYRLYKINHKINLNSRKDFKSIPIIGACSDKENSKKYDTSAIFQASILKGMAIESLLSEYSLSRTDDTNLE